LVTAQRPWGQRLANTITPLNVVIVVALFFAGIQLSHLLVARTFGLTLVVVAMLATIPLALVLIVNLRFGVFLIFMFSMVIIEIKRAAWYLEVGLIMEFLQGVLAIGIALSIISRRDLWRLSSPLTGVVLLYLFFQTMISFHPNLPSIYNVLYALRDVVNAAVPFFAALYLVRDRRNLRLFIYLWLGTAVLIALYGLKQHYLGLNTWETAWLSISLTHVIYNQVRIFSTLGSADALGMHMAVSIVMALGMAFHAQIARVKYVSVAMIPLFVAATLFTLTRGAYLGILVGVLALAVMTRKRGLVGILIVAAIIVVGWYQINQGSLLANRVMTMFSPEQDESYSVRENYIGQYSPLIWANPLGLGPATSGRQGGVLLAAGGLDPSLIQSLAGCQLTTSTSASHWRPDGSDCWSFLVC